MVDLAEFVARFGAALHEAGLPVGAERGERFARAVLLVRPRTLPSLRWCARATLAGGPDQVTVVDRVFDAVFGGLADPAAGAGDPGRGDPTAPPPITATGSTARADGRAGADSFGATDASRRIGGPGAGARAGPDEEAPPDAPGLASAAERLSGRDFGELSPAELALLAALMGRLAVATPPRRTRRTRRTARGEPDLRATLRQAWRTGGDPVRLRRRARRYEPRRLVALLDISASMAPYARAMLQLLWSAGGARTEVFTFATRLTRLTRVLAAGHPGTALERAGRAAPDWSGGTRIGAAVKEFTDRYGQRGMARGAVVLIISDGWETGNPALLGAQLARLSRLAHRIVWVNPRTKSPDYRPLVGGMAAAWPYCDAIVSAHRLDALGDLLAAIGGPDRRP